MSALRLRRVRFKDGRTIEVLNNRYPHDEENWNGKLVENAKSMAEDSDLAGYIIITLHKDGAHSYSARIDKDAVPATMLPSFVAEIVRRYSVTNPEAVDAFRENFEWVE